MSRRWFVVLFGTALVASPAPAVADGGTVPFIDFGVQCASGAFRACASVKAWNETEADNEYLYVRLANVQGWPGFDDLVPNGLAYFSLSHLRADDCTSYLFWGCDYWDLVDRTSIFEEGITNEAHIVDQGAGYYRWEESIASGPELIVGCDLPAWPVWGLNSSCGSYFTYRITLGNAAGWALTSQTSLALEFEIQDPDGFLATECSTNPEFAGDLHDASGCVRVPEPSSLPLLATGFVALFGAGLMRRREDRSTEM
jgi:hypothetical protein